ncbi:MAG: single-stranded DNA-binding protein [Alistipes sp.]|nr:single-stranded DNA-binding protein [Alistipes sp.]
MVNKVILIGNVGMDPEVRTTESGVKVARVRLATTERLFDRQANESREHTEWHTITLWRGLADIVDRYVRKGSQIYIEGRLRTRDWMDKDNNRRYTTEILADSMNLLGRRGDGSASEGASYGQTAAPQGYAPQPAAAQTPAAQTPQTSAPGYAPQPAAAPAQGHVPQAPVQTPAAAPQAAPAPAMPADDPDDLPF